MTLLAATAASPSTAPLLMLVAILGVTYVAGCVIWPFHACRHCGDAGRFLSPTGRAWRHCPHCKGTGGKLRLGRRIFNHLAELRGRDRSSRKPR